MNAIEQYVAPAPVRPDSSQQQQGNGAANADNGPGKSFGDVYNRASNGGQSDTSKKADAKSDDSVQKDPSEDDSTAASQTAGKATQSGGVTSVIFKLAAETKKSPADEKTDPKKEAQAKIELPGTDKPEEPKAKAPEPKTPHLPNVPAPTPDVSTTAEADNAAAALKLLGAAARGKATEAEDTEPKSKGADEKKAGATSKMDDAKADAANALLAASLVVTNDQGASDNQQQDQPKGNSGDSSNTKTIAASALVGKITSEKEDALSAQSTDHGGKPESVTVVDARRFIGSGHAVSPNTQAVVAGIKGDGDWSAAMKAASAAATEAPEHKTATPVNTLKIQMTPESLGNVTATLRLHGDQLTVHLTVESGEAFKQLSHDKDGLVQSLKSQGFSVDQVSIQLSPAAPADKSVAQTSTGQQAGGQQMQDGSSAGQFAQQGRGQENNRRQQENGVGGNWRSDEKSSVFDSGAAAAVDSARSGQVYL